MKEKNFIIQLLALILTIESIQAMPPLIDGSIFDNVTGAGRSEILINVTGNTTGHIYTGYSYYMNTTLPYYSHPTGAAYSTGQNISYATGEVITVESIRSDLTGYVGSAIYTTQPGDDYIPIDLHIDDIKPPQYYNAQLTPDTLRRGMTKIANVTWKDNSGVINLFILHNGTGTWANHTVVLNESLNLTDNNSVHNPGKKIQAELNATNFTRGTKVFWKLVASDMSGNVNDSFPLGNFTVGNALPTVDSLQIVPAYPYDNATINCSGTASDLDGDNITLTYNWVLGSTTLNITNTSLSPGNFSGGDTLYCRITPYDGIEYGVPKNTSVQIQTTSIRLTSDLILGWNLLSITLIL